MKFKLIRSGYNTGEYNMKFDMKLVDEIEATSDFAFFRIYYWKPFAISLGAHQKFEDIDLQAAKKDNIDVVKRPTGGRAILHAEELTYSVVISPSFEMKPKEIYEKVSLALARGLRLFDEKLSDAKLEENQPDFASVLQNQSGMLCFASAARNEVKFRGKKLIGSAQRKIGGKILQHGSILIGSYHRNLPNFLNVSEKSKTELKTELIDKTTEVETILNRKILYSEFEEAIIAGWQEEWNAFFV